MSFWTELVPLSPANLNNATVPVGGIIMFSGTVATLPSGWALCDGTSGTPDLRGRFIVGSEGAYSQGDTGGADSVTLTEAQMPSHDHTGPSHTHGSGTLAGGSHIHGSSSLTVAGRDDLDGNSTSPRSRVLARPTSGLLYRDATANAPMLGSSIQGNTDGASVSVSGSTAAAGTGSTGSAGSGASHENRPPFYALAFIQRVA